MDKPLQPWLKGDRITAEHLQQAVNRLNSYGRLSAGPGISIRTGPGGTVISAVNTQIVNAKFVAKIVDEGPDEEDDFTDNRYWVKKQIQKLTTSSTATSAAEWADDPEDAVIKMAINIDEVSTHLCLPDDIVVVSLARTAVVGSTSYIPRYEFSRGIGGAVPTFWAKITGSAGIAIGVYNRWKYSWVEQERTADGFQDKVGGRTGSTAVDYALNSMEMNNSETGVQGNGINHGTTVYPPGWLMRAASAGTPIVRMWYDTLTSDGSIKYTFSVSNSEEGVC